MLVSTSSYISNVNHTFYHKKVLRITISKVIKIVLHKQLIALPNFLMWTNN